jgi:hypothetical protein
MIADRRLVRFVFAALFVGSLLPALPARAEQAFARFLPLLVDLDGWQGKKPDGMSMQMGNTSMTTATRDYQRGSAQLHASVMIGEAAAGALAPTRTGMKIETSEGHMITSPMDGLPVTRSYNVAQKSGAIIVALADDAMFSVAYNGITEDEVLPLAKKFDWKALQAAAKQK